ncbi:uncharacterized protein LOC133327783 [Musca vetustissima]|uniref:uncharacterized protein LOC133327783 n=1 Tax=Musca vetustissima TaxID=27455 RepID=UPI002AB61471|nr:uncharacterized protein LOC133327783 [Musca vetustissima]
MSLTAKNSYWTRVVGEIEKKSMLKTRKEAIKKYDFSLTLPKSLKKRVAKILPYEFDEYDKNVFIEESTVEAPLQLDDEEDDDDEKEGEKEKRKVDFNESTCSEVERLEHEYPKFVLNLEKPLEYKGKPKKKNNWPSTFICKPRKKRVCWDSKIYDMECSIWEKSLDEQAEQLMDASAERFTTWINSLGSNRDSDISKEKLKALFSIEGERRLLASIITEPKEVKAIAKTVADKWNVPEMAIELKYENYIKNRLKNVPKKIVTVAFGRTIPVKDRPWQPSEFDEPIQTVFPDELLTMEKLFKGITHLRSTKLLVDFYKQQNELPRPHYLVKSGMFREKTKAQTATEVPLYERLKLKY